MEYNPSLLNFNQQGKGEKKVKDYLIKCSEKFVEEKTFDDCKNINRLRFDFYLTDKNTIIEYDGKQHFTPVQFNGISYRKAKKAYEVTVKRDKIKNNYCKNNGIKLLRIPYTQFNNIEEILKDKLNIS